MRAQRGQRGVLRLALVYAAVLGSLSGVVWRHGRALDALRVLDASRHDRAILEAERAELVRTLERLEGRSHVVGYARRELGMRIPTTSEIVLVRWPGGSSAEESTGATGGRLTRAGAGQAEPEAGATS